MNRSIGKFLFAVSFGMAGVTWARPANYDPAQIGSYTLEDPLAFADGTKLTSRSQWPARRAEIVKIFEREMYGRTPPPPEAVNIRFVSESSLFAGLGILRQYELTFRKDGSGPRITWLALIPNNIAQDKPKRDKAGRLICENAEKVPVILMLNYHGNQELVTDKSVAIAPGWSHGNRPDAKTGKTASLESTRGAYRNTDNRAPFPLETILARGYAVLSACYCDVSPDVEVQRGDDEAFAYTGVFDLWPKRDPNATDNITSLGAWAWMLSRGLDLAEKIPEIDAKRSVATGFSRLAKTALLAASRDARFAVCVPNQTGGGGCPLAKRNYGENISTEMRMFPHWYCKAYGKYVDNEMAMPFDQHLLLASIAPRALFVQGYNSPWFDTEGEYLACRAASPVWAFLGKEPLPEGSFPPNYSTSMIGSSLGYMRRGGEHGLAGFDWITLLDFADGVFSHSTVKVRR